MTWPGGDTSPAVVLAGQPGIQAVFGYDSATRTWLRYIPSVPAFVNNLTALKQGQPYWFITSTAGQVPYAP